MGGATRSENGPRDAIRGDYNRVSEGLLNYQNRQIGFSHSYQLDESAFRFRGVRFGF